MDMINFLEKELQQAKDFKMPELVKAIEDRIKECKEITNGKI